MLFPRSGSGPVYLIDWHGYQQWWGPSDLAVLVNRCVPLAQLAERERLLQHYHAALVRGGVADYSLAECRADYRLGVLDYIATAIGYRHWQPWIERHLPPLLHELEQLACDALFG